MTIEEVHVGWWLNAGRRHLLLECRKIPVWEGALRGASEHSATEGRSSLRGGRSELSGDCKAPIGVHGKLQLRVQRPQVTIPSYRANRRLCRIESGFRLQRDQDEVREGCGWRGGNGTRAVAKTKRPILQLRWITFRCVCRKAFLHIRPAKKDCGTKELPMPFTSRPIPDWRQNWRQ